MKTNPRMELFRRVVPNAKNSAYPGWIRRHSNEFRKQRGIRSDFIPPDMQDEFTTYLRMQYL